MSGRVITYHYDEWVSRRVEDGTRTIEHSDGSRSTETVYSTIRVHLFYTVGNFSVSGDRESQWSYGFRVSLTLTDGQGSAIKPRTGKRAHFENERRTLSASELGVDRSMEPNSYSKLFTENAASVDGWHQVNMFILYLTVR